MARAEVLRRERVYKEKLGKRATCLNGNQSVMEGRALPSHGRYALG